MPDHIPVERRVVLQNKNSSRFHHAVFAFLSGRWTLYTDANTSPTGEAIKEYWSIAPRGKFKHASEIEVKLAETGWVIHEWKTGP